MAQLRLTDASPILKCRQGSDDEIGMSDEVGMKMTISTGEPICSDRAGAS